MPPACPARYRGGEAAIVVGGRFARRAQQRGRMPLSLGGDGLQMLVGSRDVLEGDSAFDLFACKYGLVGPMYEDANVGRGV
jgi:hypothetical protein